MNLMKNKQHGQITTAQVKKIGEDYLDAFAKSCKEVSDKAGIRLESIDVILHTFVRKDKEQIKLMKSADEKKAFEKVRAWKGSLLTTCAKQYARYAEKHQTRYIPMNIVNGIVALVKERI